MAEKLKLAVLGSTKGTDMQAIIDAIKIGTLPAEIVLVVSDRNDSGILDKAKSAGIQTFVADYKQFGSRKDAEIAMIKELKEKGTRLILLIGFMKILTPYFVSEYKGRIWNIHPSLLPKYASGMDLDVYKAVLQNHERETGCTLHEVIEKVDAGRIIMQKMCAVMPNDTPESLKERVQRLEQECILEALGKVISGRLAIGSH